MKPRSRTLVALVITALSGAVFTASAVHAFLYAPEIEVAAPALEHSAPARAVSSSELPERLLIPALNVNAAVLTVGIGKSGNMAVPPNFTDVGWYKYGALPGQVGSAVIDGHVDNGLGLDGVFKRLGDLKVGDAIYIQTKKATELHFIVSSVEVYPFDQVPTDLIFNRTDQPRLNLITCEGAWVQGQKTYDHRLVVYATLAN